MVDAERLRRVLQRVSDDLASLRDYAADERAAVAGDPARLGHVKYLFVTAIEGCIDAAQHVLSSEGWGPPETNADAMRVLAERGVLDETLATAMAAAVRFRNVLVHGYAAVDDTRVASALDELGDLESFVAKLSELAT